MKPVTIDNDPLPMKVHCRDFYRPVLITRIDGHASNVHICQAEIEAPRILSVH